jgi:single-strand DNA-binding protein
MNETSVTLVGTVISDLRRRTTPDGAELIGFRMASNERRFDRAAQEWVDGDSLYVNVTCWRRLVKGVAAAIGKGDPVVVTGRLYTRSYVVEGQRRSSTELDATTVGIDLSRCIASIDRSRKAPTATETSAEEQIEELEVTVPDTAEALTGTQPAA